MPRAKPSPSGIVSSAARDDLSRLTGLGVIRNSEDGIKTILDELGGEVLDVNSIVVRYTWRGDADVSGKVNADDYVRIDKGFLKRGSTYQWGDFDFDSDVDLDDYMIIDGSVLGM